MLLVIDREMYNRASSGRGELGRSAGPSFKGEERWRDAAEKGRANAHGCRRRGGRAAIGRAADGESSRPGRVSKGRRGGGTRWRRARPMRADAGEGEGERRQGEQLTGRALGRAEFQRGGEVEGRGGEGPGQCARMPEKGRESGDRASSGLGELSAGPSFKGEERWRDATEKGRANADAGEGEGERREGERRRDAADFQEGGVDEVGFLASIRREGVIDFLWEEVESADVYKRRKRIA